MCFLKDEAGLHCLMEEHRRLLAPKFQAVADVLERRLAPAGIGRWSGPKGGYFIVLEVPDGTAKRVVELAKAAGLNLTPAGASHPYGRDPRDNTLRLAPSYPSVSEVQAAAECIAACVLLAAAEAALPAHEQAEVRRTG